MVIKKDWKKFEEEIIAKNQKFYIYGAGLIYQKIIIFYMKEVKLD